MDHHTPSILLYTRRDCPLCDEAHRVLQESGLHPQLIDIDQNPRFHERYTDCVPVVWIDGKERFRGHVNRILLKRLLRRRGTHAHPSPSSTGICKESRS